MIYAIGDLHLDFRKEKPMDVFGSEWINHEEKIFDSWEKLVREDDLVLVPGDISWAMKLEDSYEDLKRIDELPGKKIMSKGNHDYWWQGLKKMNGLNLETINFLQNNSFVYNKIGIAGSRGWASKGSEDFDAHDEKVFRRELIRLDLSLSSIDRTIDKKIVLLHYPPFNSKLKPNEFVDIMKKYNVDICIYGHLHAEGHKYAVEGEVEGVEFHCVASDYINFMPKVII
ncbi:MAG TPA: metallophosphoesterase [Tissierellales bacterium]|nr:metallophosphoesterase [Tissierellales bacterium]